MLTEEEKKEITKRLQKSNRKIWTDQALVHVFDILERIRDGTFKRKDFFIPGMLTYEDYLYQLNLAKFV